MPRSQTPPIIPSEHISVGGSHRQHRRSRSRTVVDEARMRARQRQGKAKWISTLGKTIAAVPGGAGSDRKPRGLVQYGLGYLEYWKKDEQAWIPAVYHYRIRDKLINKAKTCDDDVYCHPRARGTDELDVTAFLHTQKTWNLERDHGWVDIPQLFDFARPNREIPTYEVPWMYDEECVVLDLNNHPVKAYRDIPFTLSSEVEGGLMEAIRRLDARITWIDFWARLPKYCGSGVILTPQALSGRGSRWRLENAVSALNVRSGTDKLNGKLWDKMSQGARDANSTRELRKLSKEDQEDARQGNTGKHAAKAGGWARPKENDAEAEEDVSILKKARRARATKRAWGRIKRSRVTLNLDYENRESQPTASARVQSGDSNVSDVQGASQQPYINFDQHTRPFNAWSDQTLYTPTYPSEIIDYRYVKPRSEDEISNIQIALSITTAAFPLYDVGGCPSTARDQSYSYQVKELLDSFAAQWVSSGRNPSFIPPLQIHQDPWRDGIEDGLLSLDGDTSLDRMLSLNPGWDAYPGWDAFP